MDSHAGIQYDGKYVAFLDGKIHAHILIKKCSTNKSTHLCYAKFSMSWMVLSSWTNCE